MADVFKTDCNALVNSNEALLGKPSIMVLLCWLSKKETNYKNTGFDAKFESSLYPQGKHFFKIFLDS